MIIGAGIGEGEQSTGAASTVEATAAAATTPARTDIASCQDTAAVGEVLKKQFRANPQQGGGYR